MIKARIPVANKLVLNAHFHDFRAAKGAEKSFGSELDFILNYKYNSVTSFVFGLAFFVSGNLLEQRFQSDDLGIWSYTSFLVSF